ncbi:unnamed protein product [Strongylus vulgaris]|uniref:Uncharacterized protein n=1 Tax=Strongylus vulgaris TaxID=40348 RepID=A0A3P7IX61_STRVU|nr:unnamed protein product [Strongylus vulgaris]
MRRFMTRPAITDHTEPRTIALGTGTGAKGGATVELGIVNKTRAGEIEAIRPKDLTAEGRDEPRILRSLEVFRKFAYSVTSISDWQQAVIDATGNYYAG